MGMALSRISDWMTNCKFLVVIDVLFSIKMDFFIIIVGVDFVEA
jgi:hypothetical protein